MKKPVADKTSTQKLVADAVAKKKRHVYVPHFKNSNFAMAVTKNGIVVFVQGLTTWWWGAPVMATPVMMTNPFWRHPLPSDKYALSSRLKPLHFVMMKFSGCKIVEGSRPVISKGPRTALWGGIAQLTKNAKNSNRFNLAYRTDLSHTSHKEKKHKS